MEKKNKIRLPAHIKPERYRLMIHPNLDNFTFRCDETAYLDIGKSTKEIILHGVDLKVESALLKIGGEEFSPKKISYRPISDTICFSFSKPVPKGKAEFDLKFTGEINDKLAGFYRSHYMSDGKSKYLASTQFEATDARRAFLCVDEPSAKAIFDLTFLVPPGHTVVSNTHIESIKEHESGHKLISFASSPRMSTYLVAYIVGELEFVETKTKEGVVVRVFVTPGKKAQAEFALETTAKMLSYYNDYFGIPYPMPLLDLIAVPDFAAGAMENWGAITYRETALLIDPAHSSASAKQRAALVIAHELAHQWFGNLVTMEWWTHLWLNEGFASWIEYLAVHHLFPEWDIWTQFVYSDLNRALELDGLKNTHPVEVAVGHPKEIREIFDAISYSKGASIIRMLADYLGENDFRKGLNVYLTKYKYGNATTEHLWDSFEEASGKPVRKMMQRWTREPGYPLVKFERMKSGEVRLSQVRFFSSALENKKRHDKAFWTIPVGYTDNVSDEKRYTLIAKPAGRLPERLSESGWINLNAGQSGVFRVWYDDQSLNLLKNAVRDKRLGASDRLGLINDNFALARAGFTDTSRVLDLLSSYKEEDNYTVWRDMATMLDDLDNILYGEKIHSKFQTYIRSIFEMVVKRSGWEKRAGEGHLDSMLRELVLAQAGKFGGEDVVKEARARFSGLVKKGGHLDPDLRAMVYNLVAKSGGEKEYSSLLKLYRNATLQEERNRLAVALGQFQQITLIKKTLKFYLSSEVRDQDAPLLFGAAASNNKARKVVWKFVKDNWKLLYSRYFGSHFLGRIITETTSDFDSDDMAEEVSSFFKKNKVPGAERVIAQAVERIKSNAAWKKEAVKSVGRFLAS